MITAIAILTVLNSLTILYFVLIHGRYKINRNTVGETLVGFNLMKRMSPNGWKGIFYLPVRNARRLEVRQEVKRLNALSEQQRTRTLRALFSWMQTRADALQFQKEFGCVNPDYVKKLVTEFEPKA